MKILFCLFFAAASSPRFMLHRRFCVEKGKKENVNECLFWSVSFLIFFFHRLLETHKFFYFVDMQCVGSRKKFKSIFFVAFSQMRIEFGNEGEEKFIDKHFHSPKRYLYLENLLSIILAHAFRRR